MPRLQNDDAALAPPGRSTSALPKGIDPAAEVVCEMRTLLSQGHAENLRDLILNYELNRSSYRIIDFTYGKGGLWEIDFEYDCAIIKTDAVPTGPHVIKKDLTLDSYSELGQFDAAVFDPPYLYGREAFDYNTAQKNGKNVIIPASQQGENSWASEEQLGRFTTNKNEKEFIERVMGANIACNQCLKKDGLLFIKVMDTRLNGDLVPNHIHCIQNLTSLKLFANFVYIAAGASTWKHHAQNAHGFWIVMKMTKDAKQEILT